MRAIRTLLVAFALVAILVPTTASAMDLNGFLGELDVRASKDLGGYKADLSLTFSVSSGKVDGLFSVMTKPSDVYMCLRLGEVAKQPIDRVVAEYKSNKGQGWGVIAKNLGIKPGSPEFHALKEGRLATHGSSSSQSGGSKAPQDKGKGRK